MTIALKLGTVATTTGAAASWDDSMPATMAHLPETNARIADIEGPAEPTKNRLPREGWKGVRGFNALLVRVGIPGLPGGPPKVARMGQGNIGTAGQAPKPITAVQQYAPVQTANQNPDWTQFLS